MGKARNLSKLSSALATDGAIPASKGGTGTTTGGGGGGSSYITMSQPGYIEPNVGFSRYYPPKTVTISALSASTSAASSTNFTFDLLKNGTVLNTYTILANQNILSSVAVTGLSLTTTDYLTVNVTSGSAYDFRVSLQYT
jgi:hypothetical protein